MNFIKQITLSGVKPSDSFQHKRSIILTNSIALILFIALVTLYLMRLGVYRNLSNEWNLGLGALVFLTPIVLNRLSYTNAGRLFLCSAPTMYLWYAFIYGMSLMPTIEVTLYDGLHLYLLAVSCFPYLILTGNHPRLFIAGVLPSIISIFFFEFILHAFGAGYVPEPGSDYSMMQMRFLLSYGIINGSCYALQSVIRKGEKVNACLIQRLEGKTKLIEAQNNELIEGRNELHRLNKQLEELLEERGRKIYTQKKHIMSYMHANSHYVRGPVARLMGFVELFRLDPDLDSKWLIGMVERETKDMDTTIRRISKELFPVD